MSMAFCGQCGYHLTAGLSSCPRCGAAVEAEIGPIEGASHADDQTIASRAFVARNPVEPAASNNPQRLVLRPGPDGGSFRETYPSMASQFPGASQSGIPLQGYSHGYTAQADFQQRMQQAQYQQEQAAQNTRGRNTGLVLILVGLLFILSTVVLFIIHNTSNTHSGPPDITATPDSITQARMVIQRYYDDVNTQNYDDAYSLWLKNPQSKQDFQDGYKHTKHDTLTIHGTNKEADGTVRVTVTVNATEQQPGVGITNKTYSGYYLVKQQPDGSWKIVDARLQ